MKRGWKIFWIACAVTAGIGFLCCLVSLAMGVTYNRIHRYFPDGIGIVKNNSWDEDVVFSADTRNSFANVREINADLYAGQVEILATDSKEVVVETSRLNSKLGFQCYMEGDELILTTKKRSLRVGTLGTGKIIVYIPKGQLFQQAYLGIGAGNLHVEHIEADSLFIDVGAGEADIDWFEAGEAGLTCGVGQLTARGNTREYIQIDCGIGEITYEADGREQDYNYSLDCGIGEIDCGGRRVSGLSGKSHIDNHAAKEMDIDCGIGSVTVRFSDKY